MSRQWHANCHTTDVPVRLRDCEGVVIKVKVVTTERDETHPVFGPIHIVDVAVIDEETGQRLTNEQILAAFNKLDIVGVCVKLHHKKLYSLEAKLWPGFGVVTAIDDQYVWLGNFEVPRQDFLEWYELD